MSPVGRFLQCSDCKLSNVFPDGVQFSTIAKEFEVHPCTCPIRIPDWLIENIVKDTAPVPDGPERRFVIVRYEGRVPMMSSCAKCARKFFTPTTLADDAIGAERCMYHKFHLPVQRMNRRCGLRAQVVCYLEMCRCLDAADWAGSSFSNDL